MNGRISATPFFSIVIGVYNDWTPLDGCLASLAEQGGAPTFEVIVVDDGSDEPAPESIRHWAESYPLIVSRQAHSGVASARNRGVQMSSGSVLVFVDADCRLDSNCLAALSSTLATLPKTDCFQLRLVGDRKTFVGKIEDLRLATLQDHLRQSNGCIRYLNTAGFAIRRSRVKSDGFAFDPAAVRAEDTLVLANLMESGELPLFATESVVEHSVSLSLTDFFLKGIWSAYQEGRTYDVIALKGVKVRASHRERLSMLLAMWKTSKEERIGSLACCVLVARQSLRLLVSFAYRFLRGVAQHTYLDKVFWKASSPRRI